MSSLKPLADRVLVKPDEAEQKTASGLYIASNAQEKPQRGEIIAVGAGKVGENGDNGLPVASAGARAHMPPRLCRAAPARKSPQDPAR